MLSCLAALCAIFLAGNAGAGPARIAVLMWHETPHDEAALAGFRDGLELIGLEHQLIERRARGDAETALAIVTEFNRLHPDAVLAVSTKGALLARRHLDPAIPLFYTAITNPVAAGLAGDWQHPGHNSTGSSNWIPATQLLAFFRQVVPGLQRLGVVYDPENPVPAAEVAGLAALADDTFSLATRTATSLEQAVAAYRELAAEGAQALWVPRDKRLYGDMARLAPPLRDLGLPVLSSTREALAADGSPALAALVADYRKLGRLVIPGLLQVLKGERQAGDIPIQLPPRYRLIVNLNGARLTNHPLPYRFAADADEILVGYQGQQLVVSGTGDSQELLRLLAARLEHELQGGTIDVPDSVGSSGGIRQLLAGKADLARTARPLKPAEQAQGLVAVPFARSPVVFVVHPETAGITSITRQQLVGIYTGTITDWQQLGGKPGRVYPVTREPGDSSLGILLQRIPGFPEHSPVAKVVYTTPRTAEILTRYPNTIGFLPLAMVPAKGLTVLALDGVQPTPATVNDHTYPLAVTFSLVHRGEPSGLAARFLAFCRSPAAAELITSAGAVPLTP